MQQALLVVVNNGTDVINLVSADATWRDILIELVEKEKLDPWNIDIVEIVDKYIATVKKLKILDLRVPANIILAASILLRLQSNCLNLQGYDEAEIQAEGETARPDMVVDPLSFRLRLPPKRKVSLVELIAALDEAMKIKEARMSPALKASPFFPIKLENFDIEAETEKLYDIIKENVDKTKMVTFSHLSKLSSIDNVLLGLFIPLLFLAHRSRVILMQEKFFSEIIIAMK